MSLDPDDIERIARRVAELVSPAPAGQRYVDAATLADERGVDRDWVYAHARELGAIRLGGPRGRLRFDRHQALAALAKESPSPMRAPARSTPRRRRQRRPKTADLIPYEG